MAKPKDEAKTSVQETREQEAAVEEAAAEERVATEFYEVQVNRKLIFTDAVSIAGKMFYYDNTRNRESGTWIVDDLQWESIRGVKDPETNLALITKKSTIANEGGE